MVPIVVLQPVRHNVSMGDNRVADMGCLRVRISGYSCGKYCISNRERAMRALTPASV